MTRVSLIRYVRDDNRKKYVISRHRRYRWFIVTRLSIFIDLIDNKTGKDATTIDELFVIVGSRFASIHRVLFSHAAHGQSSISAIFVLPPQFPLLRRISFVGTVRYTWYENLRLVTEAKASSFQNVDTKRLALPTFLLVKFHLISHFVTLFPFIPILSFSVNA